MALFIKKVFIFGSTGMAGHLITSFLNDLNKYNVINSSHNRFDNNTIILDVYDQQLVKKILSDYLGLE